jgi:hypothetical protein
VILAGNTSVLVALGVVVLSLLVALGPWLLSPYSDRAYRLVNPTIDDYQRMAERDERLGKIPIFGALWRASEQSLRDAGRDVPYRSPTERAWERPEPYPGGGHRPSDSEPRRSSDS